MSSTDQKTGGVPEGARRLFVGVRISLGAVEDLISMIESMQPVARSNKLDVRWLSPATYHITLKFLGWARTEVESALSEAIAAAVSDVRSFEIGMKGLGAFPDPKKARVLWAGVRRGAEDLVDLAKRVDRATADLGFASEAKPYKAHVTFARMKKPSDASGLLLPFSEDTFRKSLVERVVLFESVIKEKGAEYTSLGSWNLLPKL